MKKHFNTRLENDHIETLCGIEGNDSEDFANRKIKSFHLRHVGNYKNDDSTSYFSKEIQAVAFNEWCVTCFVAMVTMALGDTL